ncbi:lipoxygenase family protein [Vibrio penaeicida]|nr:lipoxygenase family protein [Vibrio penaeicida]
MSDIENNKAFLDSPEFHQLQQQIATYERLRQSGLPEQDAMQRSLQYDTQEKLDSIVLPNWEDWERICPKDADPNWRPQAVTGSRINELPEFPFPVIPQHATEEQKAARKKQIEQAKKNNWHDYKRLLNVPVHGNVDSIEVRNNTPWTVRGTEEERNARAQEWDFGVSDACLARADDWALFDASVRHISKNLVRIALIGGPAVISGLILLLGKLVELVITGQAKFETVDPIVLTVPPVAVWSADDLLFYPYDIDSDTGARKYDPQYPRPPWHEDFFNDDVIAHLQIAPETPVFDYFQPLKEPMSNFPFTDAMFNKIEGFKDDNLADAMSEGRVFVTDFGDFHDEVMAQFQPDRTADDIPQTGGRLYPAIAMFAVPKGSDKLKTIAIQPTQRPPLNDWEWWWWYNFGFGNVPHPPSKIITPADDKWTWRMAKNTFTTMYSMSNVIDHLSTHVFLWPVSTSFYRTIPESHPLSALVLPHLTSLSFNNYLGVFFDPSTKTSNPDGTAVYGDGYGGTLTGVVKTISGISNKSFVHGTIRRSKHYHFTQHGQPFDRRENGEFDVIGDYPQHDDDIGQWQAIRDWVEGYIHLYYNSDSDVANDTEVQDFFEDAYGAGVNGFPASASTRQELIDTISHLIYWMSINHGLGNLSGFQPIGALGYYSHLALDPAGRRTKTDWLHACPRLNVGMGLFEFARNFLDVPVPWHRSFGKYPQGNFMHDPRVYTHLHQFQSECKNIDDTLRAKNRNRRWAYELKLPSTLTVSPWN